MAFAAILLNEAVRVAAGFPFRGAIDELPPGEVAVIQMRNIAEGAVDWRQLARVTLPTKRAPDFLSVGNVIFATRGRRNFALALEEVPSQTVCSPHFFVLQSRQPQKLLPVFLAWQINQKPAQEYFKQAATGSHILNITRAAIESLPIVIPPLEVQHEVLALAGAAQRERELLHALIDNRQCQLDAIAHQILTPESLPA